MSKNTFFNTRFWQDKYISDLDPTEKLLFNYCLTSPFLSLSGIYEVPVKYIAVETGIDRDMVLKVFKRFENDNKIVYHDGWLCVLKYPKYQSYNLPNVKKGLQKELKSIPKDIFNLFLEKGYDVSSIGNELPIGCQSIDTREREQGKGTRNKERETPVRKEKKYLLNIPPEDVKEFTSRFNVTEKQLKSKAEDLDSWCEANGKRKKDYKKFLLVAVKKDFTEKTEAERSRVITRPKLHPDGSPVMGPNGIIMETVNC